MSRKLELSPGAIEQLKQYHYPGNVRELRNILFIAATHNGGGEINDKTIAEVLQVHAQTKQQPCPSPVVGAVTKPVVPAPDRAATLNDVEAQHISQLLQQHNNNRRKVAETLGISERTLYRKLKRYNLG
jgi:two-component system response regulator AtoC